MHTLQSQDRLEPTLIGQFQHNCMVRLECAYMLEYGNAGVDKHGDYPYTLNLRFHKHR